ncbi:MAG: chloride channel protein [Sphingobium sp.]|nr:chloride channel protein [Sphingobium sp.]MCP5399584.1 chloride channel protein [Sphingomonas sp.]
MKQRWTNRRFRALVRHSGPTSLIFRRRVALIGGAVIVGLVALIFAWAADGAGHLFENMVARYPYAPFVITPLGFALIVWITRRFAPLAAGSGIPQVIAASRGTSADHRRLVDMPTALLKSVLTTGALLVGASVGREGPTVQISAALLGWTHRILQVPMRVTVMIAGGAAGVAAAFNTPLAGITFAIEELAAAYEQRMAMLVITAVIISGMVTLGLAGNYVYFGGGIEARLGVGSAISVALVGGVLGGLSGGLFARWTLAAARINNRFTYVRKRYPVAFAAVCGLFVALLGVATGLTWGTGYEPARALIEGETLPYWFAPAKFIATLATTVSGIPGGIFAPSLATGAGFGEALRWIFPGEPASAVVLMGMAAYFTGVVRAPLTAVIIITETTGARGFMLPLLGAALVADASAQLLCKERLYHGLAKGFMPDAKG